MGQAPLHRLGGSQGTPGKNYQDHQLPSGRSTAQLKVKSRLTLYRDARYVRKASSFAVSYKFRYVGNLKGEESNVRRSY
jgi:hypothetical protein